MERGLKQHSVLVIGDQNTGKTSLVMRYIEGRFISAHFPTPLPISSVKKFTSPMGEFELSIWDTAGSEEWNSLNSGVYPKTDAVVFVVSVDNKESLSSITTMWKPEIDEANVGNEYKKFIAVNKIDLDQNENVLDDEAVKAKAEEICAPVFRISAKESIGIEELFNEIAAETHGIPLNMVNKPPEPDEPTDPGCECTIF